MKHIAIILLASCSLCARAQKVNVTWGEESKKELSFRELVRGEKNDLIKLSFDYKGGGMFSKRTVTPILSRYDKSLNEQSMREYEVDEKDINFNNLISVRGKIYMFTSQYDRDSKSTSYFAQAIDIRTLNPTGRIINLGSFEAINRTSQSDVGVELSKDSNSLVLFGMSPYSKKDNEKYYMGVYDNQMKKQWDRTVVLPYKDKFVQVLDYLVTNDGQVGVILKHYDKEISKEAVKEDGAKVPAYTTKFLLYGKGEAAPKEFLLNLQDRFVHNIQVTSNANNNLMLFGLYKNKYDGYVNGYFLATIDLAGQNVSVKKMEAFPEQLISLVKTDKQGSDKDKDPGLSSHFKLNKVLDRANGTTDYILQYYRAVYHPGSSYYNGRTWVNSPSYWMYYVGDIIDINIVSDKKTVITRIPKMQTSRDIYIYSSFQALPYGNKLVLFYNDDPKNIERDLGKSPDGVEKFGNSSFAMATIDENGNLQRKELYSHKEMKLTTCVNVCSQLEGNRIGLYAQRNSGLFSAARDMIGVLEVK